MYVYDAECDKSVTSSSKAASCPLVYRTAVSTGVHTPEKRRWWTSIISYNNSEHRDKMSDLSVVEDTLKRISSHKGIVGSVIINGDGIPIRCAACLTCWQPGAIKL